MSWKKEKSEHKWTTVAQAKRIAKDHAQKKPRHKASHTSGPIAVASSDYSGLFNGAKRIAYQRKP